MKVTGVSAVAFVALVLLGHGLDIQAKSSLTVDMSGAKNRPVSKVIKILKEMLATLQKEAQEDEDIYDKLACWCETNDKEKGKSIADAEARIARLTTSIEEMTAQSAGLRTEIANLEKEVAANQESLDKATALREKQLAEFNEEEKDLIQSIGALKGAVTVLSKHHSLLQMPKSHMMGVAASIQNELQKHASLLEGVLTSQERKKLHAFVQSPTALLQYNPQSGEVFGILSQMKETFETNLANAQKEDMANQKAFEEVKAAKEAEIAAGQEQLDTKTGELADTDAAIAKAKQDMKDTQDSLGADQKFLMMLKDKCSVTDEEWEMRQKTRAEEMEAVSKALAVLADDDAHDLFTKTYNLLQRTSSMASDRRVEASKILSVVAKKNNNPRLSMLAEKIKLDAFTRVKKAIDDMIAELLKQKADEIAHKDFCVKEFNKNEMETEKKEHKKANLEQKIATLEMTIDSLAKAIATLKAEIKEMQVQLKRAAEDREKENAEFRETLADQRESQRLLKAALEFLKGFYAKDEVALLQKQEPAGPPPPPGFDEYKNNAQSGGVMKMLQQIIDDTAEMERDTLRSETDAQKAYEDFVMETNNSIESKTKDMIHKSEAKAKAEKDLIAAQEDLADTVTELEILANAEAELHASCDFVLKNFEIRQTARDEEVAALRQAKAILSGAKFQQFLQRA